MELINNTTKTLKDDLSVEIKQGSKVSICLLYTSFLCSPRLLDQYYADRRNPLVAFAGQMTGVEGYVESTASGYLAAVAMAARLSGKERCV